MIEEKRDVVFAPMKARCMTEWKGQTTGLKQITEKKKQLRNLTFSAAAFLCLGVASIGLLTNEEKSIDVMNQMTTDFEYDETLGRLQFVSSMLPESAMVFLESTGETVSVMAPVNTDEVHAWSQEEPWIEYACFDAVAACDDATVMSVVKNRTDEYTVRLMHEDGYESIYSGMTEVNLAEGDRVLAGEQLGYANGLAAFELRKDGLSILPVFYSGD